jgi:hypothetical protein
MAKKEIISAVVQNEIMLRVITFNEKYLAKKECIYKPQIKGKFIYLMRTTFNGQLEHTCRLTYDGNLENMDFAIYRYSIAILWTLFNLTSHIPQVGNKAI